MMNVLLYALICDEGKLCGPLQQPRGTSYQYSWLGLPVAAPFCTLTRYVLAVHAAIMREGESANMNGSVMPPPASPIGSDILPLKAITRSPSGAMKASPLEVAQIDNGALVPVATFIELTLSGLDAIAASPVICHICAAPLNTIKDWITPPVSCEFNGNAPIAVSLTLSLNVMMWVGSVIVSVNTSVKYAPGCPVAGLTKKYARLKNCFTATGGVGSNVVVVLPAFHVMLAGSEILNQPNITPPAPV